jgi:ubiquinone/menaquinone biosynthesis C-methylase UbiE
VREPRNLANLRRVYSDETWKVYDLLDESLDPAGPDQLVQIAQHLVSPGARLLDAGCRDAAYLIRLVRDNPATGVGIDPVPIHIERAQDAIRAADLEDRITAVVGGIEDMPYPSAYFDVVLCRDVIEQVADLRDALQETRRVLSDDGRLLVYTVFATPLLADAERTMLDRHMGNVTENLEREYVEAAFQASGLRVETSGNPGTEWREYVEERFAPAAKSMLRLSRLRRRRDEVISQFGREIYDHVEANLHWEPFLLLGKLDPFWYVLAPS